MFCTPRVPRPWPAFDAGRQPACKSLIPDVLAKSLELVHDDLTEWEQVCEVQNDRSEILWFTFHGYVWGSQQAACLVQRDGKVSMQHMRPTGHGVENAKKDRDGLGWCSMFTTGSITRINTSADFIQVYTVHSLWATANLFVQNLPIRPSNSSPSQALSFVSIQ